MFQSKNQIVHAVKKVEDANRMLRARARLFVEYGYDRMDIAMMDDEDVAFELLKRATERANAVLIGARDMMIGGI